MVKFRPFDYLTDSEKKEAILLETLIQRSETVIEFLNYERLLYDYRRLGITRRVFEDFTRIIESKSPQINEPIHFV